MLNPKWLTTFEHLVKTRSFTKTANQLFMTQPGVSQHVRKLEEELGESLIYREGKQFELTHAGSMLADFIATQKLQHQDFVEKLKADDAYHGALKIACSGTMAMTLYPMLLDLQSQHPGLSVSLEAAPVGRIREMLMNNEIDLGISTQRIEHQGIEEKEIGQEHLAVVVPSSFSVGEDILASLAELGMIFHPDGKHYADLVLGRNFAEDYQGIETLTHRGYINQLAQILLPVSKGLGFTVLPSSVIDRFEQPEKLKQLSLAQPISQSLFLSQKKHRSLPHRYDKVLALIHQAVSEA
ncbi:LysR family transcriptional regulator [Enterovibrio coralii]|uniref:LysR family transcriptional regulator n=1 Tax=Enterovibrio coralii TaxID=294935 RepID=A0A135I3C9_9GAMM|nr:LysR family transcriptional regulator [Enterovibrio coralii]KXF79950.1 LysR family transcriptional regulator [Enterovibrio coralii]